MASSYVCVCAHACESEGDKERESSNSKEPERHVGWIFPTEVDRSHGPNRDASTVAGLNPMASFFFAVFKDTAYCSKPRNVGETKEKVGDFMGTKACER